MSRDDDAGETVQGPFDLSAEAALELEELKQHERQDAPALAALFAALQKPSSPPGVDTTVGISMLADARAYSVLRRTIEPYKPRVPVDSRALEKLIAEYFTELLAGVEKRDENVINEAKGFCISLTKNLLSKQFSELYTKKEVSDSRYLHNVNI